jgi:hypothetical protein
MREAFVTSDCHISFPKRKSGTIALTLPSIVRGTKRNVTHFWAVSCVTLDGTWGRAYDVELKS